MKNYFLFLFVVVLISITLGCEDEFYNENEETTVDVSTRIVGEDEFWDWTQATSYKFAYVAGVGRINISSPFSTYASTDPFLTDIIRGKDYLSSQGWVLLSKVFGGPSNYIQTNYPYFILYNKYRSLIRIFIFNNNPINYSKAVFTVSWDNGTDKNSLFTPSEVMHSAVNEYHNGSKTSGTVINYITDYYSHAWFVTDIPVAFDPKIDYSKNYVLRFRLSNELKGELELEGTFHVDTKTVTTNAPKSSTSGNNVYNLIKDGQKYLATVPTTEQMDKYYKMINSGLDSTKYVGHKKLQKIVTDMSKSFNDGSFKKALSSFSAISSFFNGTLGAGLSILSNFFGKSNSQGITTVNLMPLVSEGTSSLKGTLSIQTNATSFPLQLPGCNHTYGDASINRDGLPKYDYPLGVISLEETPRLAVKNETKHVHAEYDRGSGSFYKESFKYSTYQINDNVILAFNAKSTTEILDVKARLVVDHKRAYSEGISPRIEYINKFVTDKIVSGEYELLENNTNSFKYGTPLIDIFNFRNTEILVSNGEFVDIGLGEKYGVRLDNPIYLQLIVTLRPVFVTADQTPIIHSITYHLNKNNNTIWSNAGKSNALVLNTYFK